MLDRVMKALKQTFWVSPVIKSCVSSSFVLCSTEENKKVLKEQVLSKFKPYMWESAIREILIFLPICTRILVLISEDAYTDVTIENVAVILLEL